MKTGNLLFSAIQFLFVMGLFCMGGFLIALPWAGAARFKVADFFFNHDELFISIGATLVGIGLILLIGFYFMYRRQYYRLNMSTVEMSLLRSTLSLYWKKAFPTENLATDVLIHADQKLELVLELPTLSSQDHEKHLAQIEKELGSLLERQLGYKREFIVTVVLK